LCLRFDKYEAGKSQDVEARETNERLRERIRAKNENKEPVITLKLGEGD